MSAPQVFHRYHHHFLLTCQECGSLMHLKATCATKVPLKRCAIPESLRCDACRARSA